VRFLVAPDSFKGTFSAAEAARIIADALHDFAPTAEIDVCPLSDGGEGLIEAVRPHTGGSLMPCTTVDALGNSIVACWLLLEDARTAIIESAASIGLARIPAQYINIRRACSEGLGHMMLDAVHRGCRRIMVGLGGSATNDCGFGLARAFGHRLSYLPSEPERDVFLSMQSVEKIDPSESAYVSAEAECIILADVTNPLLGPQGATMTYGPQKGAGPEELSTIEDAVSHFAACIRRDVADIDPGAPGAGAAGGLGYAMQAFCNGTIRSGAEYMLSVSNFEQRCREADLIVTGEGRFDAQTVHGKMIRHVGEMGRKTGRPVIVIAGSAVDDAGTRDLIPGVTRVFATCERPSEHDLWPVNAEANLRNAVQIMMKSMPTF
jgi:glycerate 2-kinase